MMKKRVFSLFVLLVILLSSFSVFSVSSAEDFRSVEVAGVKITDANASDVLGDKTVSFNKKTSTLTLNNANIVLDNPSDFFAWGIFSNIDLTIKLIGKNSINISDGYSESRGICFSGGDLTICEGAPGSSLSINCDADWDCYGVYFESAYSGTVNKLTITGGDITVNCGNAGYSNGVFVAGDLIVSGGKLTAYAGDGGYSSGITVGAALMADGLNFSPVYDSGKITLCGDGEIIAYGGATTEESSYGITSFGDIIVNSGKLTAVGGGGNDRHSYGIYTTGDIYFNGGTTLASSVGDYGINAIYADAEVDKYDGYIQGGYIYVNNDASVTATNYSEDFFKFEGIFAYRNLEVNSGNVLVKSSTFVPDSFYYGIYTRDELIARGGEVTISLPDGFKGDRIYYKAISAISYVKLSDDIQISGIFGEYNADDMYYNYKDVKTPVVIKPKKDGGYILGDADRDSQVNIKDTTLIQKYTASIEMLTETQRFCADANEDGVVNIKDATMIQKHIAFISVEHPLGSKIYYN